MRFGSFVMDPTPWPPSPVGNAEASGRTLFRTALQWLREDREHRHELEKTGRKIRGARCDQVHTPSFIRSFGVGANRMAHF